MSIDICKEIIKHSQDYLQKFYGNRHYYLAQIETTVLLNREMYIVSLLPYTDASSKKEIYNRLQIFLKERLINYNIKVSRDINHPLTRTIEIIPQPLTIIRNNKINKIINGK